MAANVTENEFGALLNALDEEHVPAPRNQPENQFSFSDVKNLGEGLFKSFSGGGGGSRPSEGGTGAGGRGGGSSGGGIDIASIVGSVLGGGGGGGGGGSNLGQTLGKLAIFETILQAINGQQDSGKKSSWLNTLAKKVMGSGDSGIMKFIVGKFAGEGGSNPMMGTLIESMLGIKKKEAPKHSAEENLLSKLIGKVKSDPTDPELHEELHEVLVKGNMSAPPAPEGDGGDEEVITAKYVQRQN